MKADQLGVKYRHDAKTALIGLTRTVERIISCERNGREKTSKIKPS